MFSYKIKDSVIKGYHQFKIRPPMHTELNVDLEYTNLHDENAALVWIPPIEDFPPEMRQNVTDQSRFLRLCDIAGLPIGHVPRGLAGAFRKIIELEGKITALATGEPCPSFAPWQAPEATGVGVVIPCDYIITCAENDFNIISDAIDREREKESFRELHLHGVLQSDPLLESLNFPMFLLKKKE
ncbi:hypothetical protein DPMN_170049 [Dreissena polymorpha]|uniref:Uncharacterized protein n=1 Tax=Dreissena polymorpha TaxID=45954 RepID=A0A9D4DWM8_DREPO|nr:hypothetical protein DPMN_170049 [Dreissena polymorpha]